MSQQRKIRHLNDTIDRLLNEKKEANREVIYIENENIELRALIWALMDSIKPIVDRCEGGFGGQVFTEEFEEELKNLKQTLNDTTEKIPL